MSLPDPDKVEGFYLVVPIPETNQRRQYKRLRMPEGHLVWIECCEHCNGPGCLQCKNTGYDLDEVKTTKSFWYALDNISKKYLKD